MWQYMDWLQRLDIIVLALMLAYICAVVTRVSYQLRNSRHERAADIFEPAFRHSRRKLVADLILEVISLKSIALVAPYLGLVGTCLGILDAHGVGRGFGMEKHAALAMITSDLAASLITAAAGMLVAIPATCAYNLLQTRIELLASEGGEGGFLNQRKGRFQSGWRPVATRQFLELPAFALLAVLGLTPLVLSESPFFAPRDSVGVVVDLPSSRRQDKGEDRPVILQITDNGALLLNQEPQDYNGLAGRLSEVYRMRKHRTVYLVVGDAVPFQTVAAAISEAEKLNSLAIRVCLVTPRAINDRCREIEED
jgi:biopolymer transport protein ExbD